MTLQTFAWLSPLLSVIFFSLIAPRKTRFFTKRLSIMLIIILITYVANWYLSIYLTAPIASIVPAKLASLSALNIPSAFKWVIGFLLLDLLQYCLHRLHHMVPFLWRLHRLHHSDKQVDAMTSFLHHPLELVSSFVVLITLYMLFDVPFNVLLAYVLVQGLHVGFTHYNRLIPEPADRYLRHFIVTPNVHKVHHSLDSKEGNANFGQVFIWWDYLFGTYQYKTHQATQHLVTGIDSTQSPSSFSLGALLANPFK